MLRVGMYFAFLFCEGEFIDLVAHLLKTGKLMIIKQQVYDEK